MRFRLVAMLALLTLGEGLPAQSPVTGSAADGVVLEQPRIDDWEGFRTLSGRIPFELLPSVGQSAVSGTARFAADTVVDFESRNIRLSQLRLPSIRFDSGSGTPDREQRVRQTASVQLTTIGLDFVLDALPPDFRIPEDALPPAQLNFEPPRIIVSEKPARLMLTDGPPAMVPIQGTGIEFVVNTDWAVFHHKGSGRWFILNGRHWLTNNFLSSGTWLNTTDLPQDFLTLQVSSEWPEVAAAMPPAEARADPVPIIISYEPAELVEVDGEMESEAIGDSGLEFITNTRSDLFHYAGRYYLLVSGRWFHTKDTNRKWYAVKQLPGVFAGIPEDHPRARVLAAVPGTPLARIARIEAAIPRTAVVNLDDASALGVPYAGEPSFVEIRGTGLRRAENTPFQVIQHNNFYYLCHEGAWYSSSQPAGPWKPALEVPEAIYAIPPTDPAFNVTFVRLDSFDDSSGRAAYKSTSGYYSRYWTGSTMVYGTGWYYPGYWNHSVYWRYPHTYGYGWWGPYGYPYPYYRNETFEVNRPDKDWQWDLNGNKRAVYDYGPGNYVGGRYKMPESDNFKPDGKR